MLKQNLKKLFFLSFFVLGIIVLTEEASASSYWKNYFTDVEKKAVERYAEEYTREKIEEKSKSWQGLIRSYNIKNGSIKGKDIKDSSIGLDKISGLENYLNGKISDSQISQDFSADKLTGSYAALDGSQITNINPANIAGSGDLNIGDGDLIVTTSGGGFKVQGNATSPNILSGYSGNSIADGVIGSAILSGGNDGGENSVGDGDRYSVIIGGASNDIMRSYGFNTIIGGASNSIMGHEGAIYKPFASTIAGGQNNIIYSFNENFIGGGYGNVIDSTNMGRDVIGGGERNETYGNGYATIAGGQGNIAWHYASIGGGALNTAGASGNNYTVVAGGANNTASGYQSMILGGRNNTASGQYAFASGRRAKATHNGAFVWADYTDADFSSEVLNEFAIRAGGGMRIVTSGANDLFRIFDGANEVFTVFDGGNVGIGTTTPVAKLDVNGQVKIQKSSSAPFACDAAHDGTIALTSGYRTCVCNGGTTTWVFTTDGTTACTW